MYKCIDDGSDVILHVLVNADKSLIGLKFNNCEIKEITVSEMASLIDDTYGPREITLFHKAITTRLFPTEKFTDINGVAQPIDNISLIVLEETDILSFNSIAFFKTIKLYKAIDLYPCYSINYKIEKDKLKRGDYGKITDYPHALGLNGSKFSMTEVEKESFHVWFDEYKKITSSADENDQFKKALRTYNLSFYIGFRELEFVMLFTILEMLFAEGRSEITYQISRGTSLLLSNSTDEMKSYYRKVKKLYDFRSKYVHEGESIKSEDLFELREIVRKIILKLIEMEYHRKDKIFKDLREKIFCGGIEKFIST